MRQLSKRIYRVTTATAIFAALSPIQAQSRYGRESSWWDAGLGGYLSWDESFENSEGQVTIVNKKGSVQTKDHPFFEPLGVNGRACVTCHQPANAMSVAAAAIRQRWIETGGRDPIFAAIDGSNCPDLPQESAASHSLLLERGLFRIALPWPPRMSDGAAIRPEFRIEVVRDPTGCNTGRTYGLKAPHPQVSVYRRPRVAANLDQLGAGPQGMRFMTDGREATLESQAISAILIHEQAEAPPALEQLRRIVEFETQLYAAQGSDVRGGLLEEPGGPAILGPGNLASGKANAFASAPGRIPTLFDAWRKVGADADAGVQLQFRASVARGSDLFFSRRFQYRGETYTCASCHAAGITRWMDIGTTTSAAPDGPSDLPTFRITCDPSAVPHPVFGRVIYTHDPGRALISGRCADVGSIVLGQIRGLAARAPYFSDGSAPTLRDLIDFYDLRFGMGYSALEKRDLENFLRVL